MGFFIMDFQYKNVLIWGYGVSGRAVEKVLIDMGVDYTILDEGEKINGGGFVDKISKKTIINYDLIVLSPGVDYTRKEIAYAKSCGINVISEIEFGYMFVDADTKIVAVSGTNGKTTTVDLVFNMITNAGYSVCEVGNIGKPFSEIYGKHYDYIVVELSSFQLDMCKNFRADIAILLNIAPDHIDRHKTFANYINAKLKIFNNQQKKDYAIINYDDSLLRGLKNINSKKLTFSTLNNKAKYSCINDKIYKGSKEVLDISDAKIENIFLGDILAMMAVADILGVDIKSVEKTIKEYELLAHRCEFVAKIDGVSYYNDSKATNIHAVENCLKNLKFDNVLLLLGGRNKSLDFKDFIVNMNPKVKKIIAFGECGKKIYALRKYNKDIEFVCQKNLHKTMSNLHSYLDNISAVVLSPACSSFDEFTSYMDRGDFFKKSILEMKVNDDKEG